MPDKEELDQRFANVMASVNLTPESAQFLWDYDDKKKWNLICEHDGMIVKKSPQEYVAKLKVNFKCFQKNFLFKISKFFFFKFFPKIFFRMLSQKRLKKTSNETLIRRRRY